jgi:uncharacterized protein YdeI (YjbR/CyaY-like superfamily)
MGKTNPKFDEYISKSADFAKPILLHFRKIVHEACPDVEEEMKWSMPHFMYKGMLCGMAAFKNHCAIGFWKGSLLFGDDRSEEAMGHFGKIGSLSDLPSDKKIRAYVKEAMRLNEEGIKPKRAVRAKEKKDLEIPVDFQKALRKDRRAASAFEKFSPSHKKEYVEWLTEAKTDSTREKRLATAIEWISEGKSRHWKYKR